MVSICDVNQVPYEYKPDVHCCGINLCDNYHIDPNKKNPPPSLQFLGNYTMLNCVCNYKVLPFSSDDESGTNSYLICGKYGIYDVLTFLHKPNIFKVEEL
jgi:hypothetical protein